jgi:hypothetical protein
MKTCSKCGIQKSLDDFHKDKSMKDGHRYQCKQCIEAYTLNRYHENAEVLKQKTRDYKINNRDKVLDCKKRTYAKNKDYYLSQIREWAKKNKDHVREYQKRRLLECPQLRLRSNISRRLNKHFKLRGFKKDYVSTKTILNQILNYSLKDLKIHLELQFKEGMTWENYGKVWHIDHKTPDSWFEYKSMEDDGFKKSWALENLQPMLAEENRSKGNRYAS